MINRIQLEETQFAPAYGTCAQDLREPFRGIDICHEYKRLAGVFSCFYRRAAHQTEVAALKISEAFTAQQEFEDPTESLPGYDNESS